MPPQTIDALLRSLKRGDVAPAYYLYGAEDLLKEEAIRAVLDRVLDPGLRDFNFDQRSAAQADPEEVYSLCRTPPMMADRRVIVLRDVEEDKDLTRLAVPIACHPLPPERAARWVLRRAGQLGTEIEPGAAELLVRVVGVNLAALAAELEKVVAASDELPVTAERVAALVGIRHDETMYDWRDAVFEGDAARATRLLGPVLDQGAVTGVKLLTLVGTTLVGVGSARAGYDRNLRGSRLEDATFQLLLRARPTLIGLSYREEAKRWARWAPSWPAGRLRAALREAVAADTALKNTTISDERGVLLDLVL